MKKLFIYLTLSLLAFNAFAKTSAFMMRNNGPLREDKGNGGVEWALSVPQGTMLTLETEEPVALTLITEKENFDNIKFYKVSFDKKTYYVRESEVALGESLTVILDNTTLFTKPAISSFLNAQIETASIVVAGKTESSNNISFTEVQYWSDSASQVRKRWVFSDKVSSNKSDLEAVQTVEVATALKNKDAAKEYQMKKELFDNAKKLNASQSIRDYIDAEYEKVFGKVVFETFYNGVIKTADGSKVNAREAPVTGAVKTQLENGETVYGVSCRSTVKSTYDGITDYWYGYETEVDGCYWVFGGYIEWSGDRPNE